MARSYAKPPRRSISTLIDSEKKKLAKHVFPQLDESELRHAWPDIQLCFEPGHPDHELTFVHMLRANQWFRQHGFQMAEFAKISTAAN